jgi:AraC family transcriptional regulator
MCTQEEGAAPLRGVAARQAAALAADAQVLIAECFTERVTLQTLAETLDVSPFRLCRAFRYATGGTLHEHLTRLRLATALEKLPQYRRRLTALALDLGFSSHSHFTQCFRSRFGYAPTVFVRDR